LASFPATNDEHGCDGRDINWANGSWEPRLRRYLSNDVLILDDFGMREFTPTQAEDLYVLICAKFRTGSMIVTSNRAPTDWYALFPNAVLAESALDRLVNSAHHVLFKGRTYRPLRRPDGAGKAAVIDEWPETHQLDQPDESRAAETARHRRLRTRGTRWPRPWPDGCRRAPAG
jgi:hypothetical protein